MHKFQELLECDLFGSSELRLLQHDCSLIGRHILAQLLQYRVQLRYGHSCSIVAVVLLEHALELVDLLGRELLQEDGRHLVAHGRLWGFS